MSMDRCTRCILSGAFPGISFDENGVCSFCRDEIIASTDATAVDEARKRVDALFSQKGVRVDYDAVICYSGGKDSTYTLKQAVEKYRLKVLAFTLDNGFISPTAFANIRRVVDNLGVDHILFRPAKAVFNKIIRTCVFEKVYLPGSLRRISAGCYACISMVNNLALRLALEKKAPFIIAGFTLGQIPANAIIYQNNYRFLADSRKRSLDILKTQAGPEIGKYFLLPDDLVDSVTTYPYTINLLCLEEVTEEQIVAAIAPIGWQAPQDVDGCSSNCRLNVFNNYVHRLKFGYSPYELELSHLIRNNLLSRSEALEKVRKQPQDQLESVMRHLQITKDQLLQIVPVRK